MDLLGIAALSNAVLVSVLAVVVLGVDRLARRPALSHRLWLLLLLKLVTPPLICVPLAATAAPAPEPAHPTEERGTSEDHPVQNLDGPGDAAEEDSAETEPGLRPSDVTPRADGFARAAAVHARLGWGPSISGLWMIGTGLFLGSIAVQFLRIRRIEAAAPRAHPDVRRLAREMARELGVERRPSIRLVPRTISPGLWALGGRPRILIPVALWDRLDIDQRRTLLAHEMAHLRRHDHWVRLLELAVTALYWWFPVVWWIRRSLREAEEQCCDARVVAAVPGSRMAYARTLLDTIDFLAEARSSLPPAACGIGPVDAIRGRLKRIMTGAGEGTLSLRGSIGVAATALVLLPLAPALVRADGHRGGYAIVDLGPFQPTAINNRGQVVGNPFLGDTSLKPHAYLWEDGRWTDLGGPAGGVSFAADINDRGQVTGWFTLPVRVGDRGRAGAVALPEGWSVYELPGQTLEHLPWLQGPEATEAGKPGIKYTYPHAFRADPGRPIDPRTDDLGTLGGVESYGRAINNRGQVVGQSTRIGPGNHRADSYAFRTGPDLPIDPRTDDVGSRMGRAVAINDRGEAIVLATWGRAERSYLAAPGRRIDDSDDVGPADDPDAYVRLDAMNNRGQVIGECNHQRVGARRVQFLSFRPEPGRPFRSGEAGLRGISYPVAIDNMGRVVGHATSSDPLQPYKRLAIHDGRGVTLLSDLVRPDSGWLLSEVADINDRAQIVGCGVDPRGRLHGFLLEPLADIGPFYWLLGGMSLTGLCRTIGGRARL
jgi:probable HAF family extracellular repeat protein